MNVTAINQEGMELKKVLMLRSVFDIGGVEKHIAILSGELLDRGIHVEIGSAGGAGFSFPEMERIKKIHIELSPSSFRNIIPSVITLFKLVKRGNIQIIHSHHRFSTICAWIVSKLLSVPLISTEHGFFLDRKFLVRLFQPDHFVTATEKVKNYLIEFYRIRPEKISVIPNAVKLDENNKKYSKKIRGDLTPKGDLNICYGGRLSEEKGLIVLLDSWEKIARRYPEAHLWIVGDGIMRSDMEKIVSVRGLSGQTTFTGFMTDESEFLPFMDLVVLPSIIENMPMILLEAMCRAIPVIATDVGGVPELVENGKEGVLVRAGDSESLFKGMKTLIEDTELRKKMGVMGRKKVSEKFNSKKMGDQYISLYTDVIKRVTGGK